MRNPRTRFLLIASGLLAAAAISAMVAWVPFSSISRQRNARATALTMALSMRRRIAGPVSGVPSGARTSFRPPRRRIEIGIRTVRVRPSLVRFDSLITPPSGILV